MNKKLSFNNISLVPRVVSSISSRDKIDCSIKFCNINLELPIIASPMKDVCNGYVAKTMRKCGAYGIIHRFCSIEEQVKEFVIANKDAGCAIGINGDAEDRFKELYKEGCRIFCLDVANGANNNIQYIINKTINYKDIFLIVGNIASKETLRWIRCLNRVYGVRLGIGSGEACTTTKATGIFYPHISLLQECVEDKSGFDNHISLIMDGGIKEPRDFCKSIGLGADLIMLGSLIASCNDSPAESFVENGKIYKKYRGSASLDIQESYKEPRYIEGTTKFLKCTQDISSLLKEFKEGLQSSMSYFDSKNIMEYRKNISYICL